MGIKDKISINDDYIAFLLNNPCDKILKARKKHKVSWQAFADLLGVSDTSVRRWELGNTNISRKKYERLKEYL